MRRIAVVVGVVGAVLVAGEAAAQSNPCGQTPAAPVLLTATSTFCFEASADHDVVLPGGQPLVSEYAVEFYLKGSAAPFWTTSIGKPARGADGAIRGTVPTPQGMARVVEHVARVVAVGPTGSGRSDPSNGFFTAGAPTAPGVMVVR